MVPDALLALKRDIVLDEMSRERGSIQHSGLVNRQLLSRGASAGVHFLAA